LLQGVKGFLDENLGVFGLILELFHVLLNLLDPHLQGFLLDSPVLAERR